ncbi:hypothetical protein AC579_1746 [Pseudocercospora musae]|uniref:Ecp2 effector protein domain-containing protein n=1 Tax=Pseudocercospora musae TaxID=113226 RepID=A0A139H0M1_9PEZI|nr:hypothetical protein AC579_1746 [Pseudocercospora musae]
MHSLHHLMLLLGLTPLAHCLDIQMFSGPGCTDASWKVSNLPAHFCLQTLPIIYSSPEMSAEFFGVEPWVLVYAYNGTAGSGPCDYKNVKKTFSATGGLVPCFDSFQYAAFVWDYYDPNLGNRETQEMKCEGVKGPDSITLVDGTEIDLIGMEDEERDELWELAVKGKVKGDLPAKFADFMRE